MTWNITQMRVADDPQDGTIVVASFSVTDGTSEVTGDTRLNESDAISFTTDNDVTKAQCVEWVKNALGEDYVAACEADVAAKTNAEQPEAVPLPWEQ